MLSINRVSIMNKGHNVVKTEENHDFLFVSFSFAYLTVKTSLHF